MTGLTQNIQLISDAMAHPDRPRTEPSGKEIGQRARVKEATAVPPRRLQLNEAYSPVRAFILSVVEAPVFERKERD